MEYVVISATLTFFLTARSLQPDAIVPDAHYWAFQLLACKAPIKGGSKASRFGRKAGWSRAALAIDWNKLAVSVKWLR